MPSIAQVIKKLMDERKWSSGQLEEHSGVKAATTRAMFMRNSEPDVASLKGYAKAFGMSVDELIAMAEPGSDKVLSPGDKVTDIMREYQMRQMDLVQQIFARLRTTTDVFPVVPVPVYEHFPHEKYAEEEPLCIVYAERPENAGAKLEGYRVPDSQFLAMTQGTWHIENNLVIDKSKVPKTGNLVVCALKDRDEVIIGRYRDEDGRIWIATDTGPITTESCCAIGVVIGGYHKY